MTDSELLKKYGFKEEIEEREDIELGNYSPTGFPKPTKRYRMVAEDFSLSMEERYFWLIDYMRDENGFADIEKLMDVFSAGENSSFFGASQQRLGMQQDKVSNFLATIGKMTKELFQLVRELRILDERLGYYYDSYSNSKSRESAEITLKGIWVDMVEQGSKNPASVYGMARELGFATLPDLFFGIHPAGPEKVDEDVDRLDFNRKLKEVLKRKLRTYLQWKKSTFSELKSKRKFTLKYLRQHFDTIKLYMHWVKPYLRNIRRLQMDTNRMDSPEIISAFETSFIELEVLFRKKFGNRHACVLAHFDYRTAPAMNYHQEYQRGPLHIGKVDLTLRAYSWTDEDLRKYRAMKNEEDFRLLSYVDNSVKNAMEALGEELMNYLKEAGEDFSDDPDAGWYLPKQPAKPEKVKQDNPFAELFKGLKIFSAGKGSGVDDYKDGKDKDKAKGHANKSLWNAYKDYKKTFKHLSW
ncbi:MAG: hypothetical protein ACQEP1_06015 [Nanobdellota archaeon]